MDEHIKKSDAEAFYQNFIKLLAQEIEKSTGVVEIMVDKGVEAGLNMMIKAVRQIPPADVAPVVHGEWIIGGVGTNGVIGNWHCSVCNGVSLKDSEYCPDCGALMDGGKSNG